MKKIILALLVAGTMTSVFAEDLVGAVKDVLKAKIEADKEVAINNKATVEVSNSTLKTKSKMGNDNVVVGNNGGIVAVGGRVEIDNSDISAESDMGNNNVVVGNNGGVVLGAH